MFRLAVLVIVFISPATFLCGGETSHWAAHPLHQWVRHSPRETSPAPRLEYEGSGAWAPDQRLWIHFAGHDGIPQGFCLFTCALENGIWKQRFPNTSPPGVCCVDGGNTYDEARGRFVAFPGGSLGHGYQWSRGVKLKQSNVWLYDPAADHWTNMRPPPYRLPEKYSRDVIGGLNHGATYDANHEVSIAFGGQGAGGSTNSLYVYDAYANRLGHLRPPDPPEIRDGMGLCYDTVHDCLVMFGSQYGDDERTWLYRFGENRWEGLALDPHPPAKKEGTYSTNPKMAFDPASGLCLCVVRRGESSGLPPGTLETWTLDVGKRQWTRENPAVAPEPSASRARNLSFSAELNVFVLESVAAEKKGGPQLWTYRLAPAPAITLPTPPVDVRLVTNPGRAELRWRPGDDATVTSYNVYRAAGDDVWTADFKKLASTRKSEFADTGLEAGRTYFYRVASGDAAGREGRPGRIMRTQPEVLGAPVVSVIDAQTVEVSWKPRPDDDIVGYDVYRGIAAVQTVRRGTPAAWTDNDPEYAEPQVVAVTDIVELRKLNDAPVAGAEYADHGVDLTQPGAASGDYRFAVYAYIVRAINRLGTAGGPSPYALTIPSEPQHVLLRERDGSAEIRWNPAAEKSVTGYHIYKLGKSHWEILRLTDEPVHETTFRESAGANETRYWVVPVDRLGQEGQPSSPVWCNHAYRGFFDGDWHQ
jgi:hypothetical protein